MKDPFKDHCQRIIQHLHGSLFLHEYQIEIAWDHKQKDERGTILGTISIDDRYLKLKVSLSKELRKYYRDGQAWELASVLVHEFCHVFTEPLYLLAIHSVTNHTLESLETIRERQTQRITNVVMSQLPERIYAIKERKKK